VRERQVGLFRGQGVAKVALGGAGAPGEGQRLHSAQACGYESAGVGRCVWGGVM